MTETPASKKKLATEGFCPGLSIEALKKLQDSLVGKEIKVKKPQSKYFPKVTKLPYPENISQEAKESINLLKLALEEIEDLKIKRTSPLKLQTLQSRAAKSRIELHLNPEDIG